MFGRKSESVDVDSVVVESGDDVVDPLVIGKSVPKPPKNVKVEQVVGYVPDLFLMGVQVRPGVFEAEVCNLLGEILGELVKLNKKVKD